MADAVKITELTMKQKLFVSLYVGKCKGNATQAAIEAGYSENSAREIASNLLTKVDIKSEIEKHVNKYTGTANDVLHRLFEYKELNVEDFYDFNDDGTYTVNFKKAQQRKKTHLIKSIKTDRYGNTVLEFHDASAANTQLGKFHRLFADKVELTAQTDGIKAITELLNNKQEDNNTESENTDNE